jgi:hypothetical protein
LGRLGRDPEIRNLENGATVANFSIATGSRMVWDGYNYNGDRASSGVYLVFIADPNGNRTKVCRFLIVN